MTEETKRKPDYFEDINRYGKFGEDLFIKTFQNILNIVDVRKNKTYQKMDIDFLVSKSDGKFFTVDVKVDTVSYKTGNYAYEVVSHGANGWSIITQADFVFIIDTIEEKDNLIPIRGNWVDMKKWKQYCSRRDTKKKMNVIFSENIVDLLCPIEELYKNGVIDYKKSKKLKKT